MVKVALLLGVSDYRPDLNLLLGANKDVEAIKRVLQYPDLGNFAEFKSLINFVEYGPDLNSLLGAHKDVEAIKRVLQNPDLGGFGEVKPLLNVDTQAIQQAMENLFLYRQPDDILLLYLSGHGVIDDSGKLYFITAITRKNAQGKLVKSTAVSASLIHEIMSNSKSKRQVVILDCCFSNDFDQGEVAQADASVVIKKQLGSEGRVILTASTSTQYFFKYNESGRANYTHYLVEGIETGSADVNGNGVICIKELHEYASSKVQKAAPAIKPAIYEVEESDVLWLAHTPVGDPKLNYYRKAVERGVSRNGLDELRETLGLLLESAIAIENEVLKPHREYQKKLQYYAYVFFEAIQHKSAFSDETRNELERFQQILGLTDRDVTPIKAQIASQIEKVASPEQLAELPKAQVIAGGSAITTVKPLAKSNNQISPKITAGSNNTVAVTKAEMPTISTLPIVSSAQRNTNISLNRTTPLLMGAGLVSGMALLGASYAYARWEDSQQLQKIKILAAARNYHKCLTQAQAVPQKSSRYTDAQKLLKQCETSVNWQNVQVRDIYAHPSPVWSVVFSPERQTLASASEDKTIKIWNFRTRKLLRTFSGHSGHVWSVAISPDGQTLASSSGDKTIKLWNLQTGKLLRILNAHSHSVWSVAFSPNGKSLAAGSFDRTITLWDVGSGSLLRTLSDSGSHRSVTFSPDGHLLTSGSGDKTIQIWNLQTRELPRVLSGHRSQVLAVIISPDGQTLASGSEDKTIRLWNLRTYKLLHTLSGHTSRVTSVTISPDGQTLASGSEDETIKIWNLQTGKLLRTLSGHVSPVISIAFSPDGQTLASGSQSGKIKLWWRD